MEKSQEMLLNYPEIYRLRKTMALANSKMDCGAAIHLAVLYEICDIKNTRIPA